jgi:hypothetical protein
MNIIFIHSVDIQFVYTPTLDILVHKFLEFEYLLFTIFEE